MQSWSELPVQERKARLDAADAVVAKLDAERKRYTEKSAATQWRWAREDARLVAQAAKMFDGQANGSNVRDEAMAENVGWILAQEAKGTKVVLWGHNAHIATHPGWMGKHLRQTYGDQYLTFGFAFAEGSFQAIEMSGQRGSGLREVTLGPAPETDVSAAFARAGCDRCIVDLRNAPKGEVADWFAAPHPMRETGAVFTNEENMTSATKLAELYDAIIFVRSTTRARPNPRRQ
jgi:erythromycin esterase